MFSQKGFSLIEAIVTLAIAAIVLSFGVPGFQSYIQSNRQTTTVNDLATALQLARSTAISRRVRVTVCKSNDGANCTAAGNWAQGWMVFTDPSNHDVRDADEDILRVHGAVPGNVTISGNRPVANRVAFKPQGMLDGFSGTITYCDSRGSSYASGLTISLGGFVQFKDDGSLTC